MADDIWDIEELIAFGHTVHCEKIEFHGKTLPVYWHELEASEVPSVKGYVPKGDSDTDKKADFLVHATEEKVWAMIEKGQRLQGVAGMSRAQYDALPESVHTDIIATILDLKKKMRENFLGGQPSQ